MSLSITVLCPNGRRETVKATPNSSVLQDLNGTFGSASSKLNIVRFSIEETLLPSLLNCFGLIFLGYILGKTKILGQRESRGLTIFVQYLSLPALIFVSVSTIHFTAINWPFVAAIFVSKSVIFICVAIVTIFLSQPHDLGKAGLYAISTTQSNDFALGYQLIVALYGADHPEYPSYLYIFAPIQLLVLNTIGFVLLEIEEHGKRLHSRESHYCLHVVKNVLQNPVVIMSVLGLIWNVTYGEKIPSILNVLLKALSAAFPATALLLVGYTMTAKRQKTSGTSLSIPLLVLAKCLLLPLLLQKVTKLFLQNNAQEVESYSGLGFLYGTIPTAPTVHVFATHYQACIDEMARVIVLSTLISAPLMFASAFLIQISEIGVDFFTVYMSEIIGCLGCFNVFISLWLLFLLCTKRRWKSISFNILLYLTIAQLLMSSGGALLLFSPTQYTVLFAIQYVFTCGGIYATRTCTLVLATLLLIVRIRSLCFVLQHKKLINALSVIFCILLPYLFAGSLLFFKTQTSEPNFQLGFPQYISTISLTVICLFGTISCLIGQEVHWKQRWKGLVEPYLNPAATEELECESSDEQSENEQTNLLGPYCDIEDIGSSSSKTFKCTRNKCESTVPTCCKRQVNDSGSKVSFCAMLREKQHVRTEDESSKSASAHAEACDTSYGCSSAQRSECAHTVEKYLRENFELGTGLNDTLYFHYHISFSLVVCIGMVLSLSSSLCKLFNEEMNGVVIEIDVLDVLVNYNIGFGLFLMFGLEMQIFKSIRHAMNCFKLTTDLNLPSKADQEEICNNFMESHFKRFHSDVSGFRSINECDFLFHKQELMEWLLKNECADSLEEAGMYLDCLFKGQIIEEVIQENLQNNDSLYKFSNSVIC